MSDVTRILQEVKQGDRQAAEKLLPLVYEELRALARTRLRQEAPGQTLQPTALVHEAYLRLVGKEDPGWDSRGHFFAAAAQAMRRILVEQARRKMRKKHGGGRHRVPAEDIEPVYDPPAEEILAIDKAIKRLESLDPRKGQIVNLRYFARMTTAETAVALGISVDAVIRDWRYARTWLEAELARDDSP